MSPLRALAVALLIAAASSRPAAALKKNDCKHLVKAVDLLYNAQKLAVGLDASLLEAMRNDVAGAAQQIDAYRGPASQVESCGPVVASLGFRDKELHELFELTGRAHKICAAGDSGALGKHVVVPSELDGDCVEKAAAALQANAKLAAPQGPLHQHWVAASGAPSECGALPLPLPVILLTSPCLRAGHCPRKPFTDAANAIRSAWRDELSKPKRVDISTARAAIFPLLNQAENCYRAGPRAGKEKELFESSAKIAVVRAMVNDLWQRICN